MITHSAPTDCFPVTQVKVVVRVIDRAFFGDAADALHQATVVGGLGKNGVRAVRAFVKDTGATWVSTNLPPTPTHTRVHTHTHTHMHVYRHPPILPLQMVS